MALTLAVGVCSFVFHVDYSEFAEYGRIFAVCFVLLMNVCYLFYDLLLRRLCQLYRIRFQPLIRRMFR